MPSGAGVQATRLTQDHVYPTAWSKMRVDHASAVLCEEVAHALELSTAGREPAAATIVRRRMRILPVFHANDCRS